MHIKKSRRVLYRWIGWYFLVNTVLSLFIGVNYIRVLPDFHAVSGATLGNVTLTWIFLILSLITQVAILFFAMSLMAVAWVTLFPRRWLAFIVSIVLATLVLFALIVDSITFGLYHMHYAGVGWAIIKAGALTEVLPLSTYEKLLGLSLIGILLVIEYVIALLVWRRISRRRMGRLGYMVTGSIVISGIFSYGLMFVATAMAEKNWLSVSDEHLIYKAARIIPYYNEVYGLVMPGDSTVRRILTEQGEIYFQIRGANRPLNYPLHPLKFKTAPPLLNVVIISIDTWRYDAMNPIVTPNIYQFAQKTLQFQNNWSGGNCTQPGIFSLFYGLPPNYWRATLNQSRGPVMLKEMLKDQYQMGIFTSAPLNFPAFNRNVFRDVRYLIIRTPGHSSAERDKRITKKFLHFIDHRNRNHPFFSFLFYDALHNYCESGSKFSKPFGPAVEFCDRFSLTPDSDPIPYVNRYHNAAYFVDQQVKQVFDALEKQGLLKNTVVMITADHGEQLNDERMGYWEHASAYTPYQLHVPLLVYWPGKNPQVYSYLTTHYDVVPTIMKDVLGAKNPTIDYSVGKSLFDKSDRPYFIAGSYADYAVVTKKDATRIYPGGDYMIDSPTGHPMYGALLDRDTLQEAFRDLNRYFQW